MRHCDVDSDSMAETVKMKLTAIADLSACGNSFAISAMKMPAVGSKQRSEILCQRMSAETIATSRA